MGDGERGWWGWVMRDELAGDMCEGWNEFL